MERITVSVNQINVGPRFRKELGDIESLAKNIQELGLLQPIVLNENYDLIAGERRLEACKSLGWNEMPAVIVNLQDIIRGEFAENAFRKEFTVSEMVAIKRAIEPLEREQARERQLAGQPPAESAEGGGAVRDRIASSLGVSHDTLKKAEAIVAAAEQDPERFDALRQKVDRKEVSVNAAYKELEPRPASLERKKREAKDILFLPAELFEAAIAAIESAKANGENKLTLRHDGHQVKHVGTIELAT